MTNIKEEMYSMMKSIRCDLELAYEGELKNEDGEQIDLWEYLADTLNVDYRVGFDKTPTACRIWLAVGGPDIWVDTETNTIYSAWGLDKAKIYITSELSDAIFESMTLDWDCY